MSIFTPFEMFESVTAITPEYLKRNNINTLLLDVDNTLSCHHAGVLYNGVAEWLEKMKKSGISLFVVSNSKNKRIEPFAKKIGLPFEALSLKPLTKGINRAIKRANAEKKTTALVGDQLFTDVWGAKKAGIFSILVKPIDKKEEIQIVFKRYLEKIGLHFYRKECEKNAKKN